MSAIVALSDDVTGAAAVAAELHAAGLRARVVRAGDPPGPGEALVIDTGTRTTPPGEAAEAVARALDSVEPPSHGWFKRIDTGLRGNVAAELEALVAALGRPLVVAAAAPGLGIATLGGVQQTRGVPVSHTHYADGPDRPATSSLTELLPGSIAVGLDEVRGPQLERTLVAAMSAGRHAVCDGVEEADLARVAAALAGPALAVPVGSYGLARHWASGLASPGRRGGPVLTAISSVKALSIEQAEIAAARGAHIAWAAHEADLGDARRALAAGTDAVLLTAGDGARPATTAPAERLAERVLDLATAVPVAGLVLVGGDLATSFLRAARAAAEPIASPWPATAVVTLSGGPLDGQVAVFKSGSRGGPGWIEQAAGVIRCVRRLLEDPDGD